MRPGLDLPTKTPRIRPEGPAGNPEAFRMPPARHILTLSCVNRPGIVAKVATALFDGSFNILDAQQFDDVETGDFFMRVEFNPAAPQRGYRGLARKVRGDRRGP